MFTADEVQAWEKAVDRSIDDGYILLPFTLFMTGGRRPFGATLGGQTTRRRRP